MKKGFTLIELLVVIAIIGILASIVMISMSGASNQAKDARIQGDLTQVRSLAELIHNDDSSYADVCTSTGGWGLSSADTNYGSQLVVIQTDIDSQQGLSSYGSRTICIESASAYCVSARLVSDTSQWFCVDSVGRAWATTASACTTTNTDCL